MVRPVTVEMEKTLNLAFQDLFFGDAIAQLAIVVISVSSDENEQKRWCKGYNRIGSVRHPFTGEKIRSIGLAVLIDPEVLAKMSGPEFRNWLRVELLEKTKKPDLRIPKKFDYESFSRHLGDVVGERRH